MKVAVESANCFRDKMNLGYNEIHNICSGEIHRIDWTIMDWGALVFGVVAVVAVAAFFITMIRL